MKVAIAFHAKKNFFFGFLSLTKNLLRSFGSMRAIFLINANDRTVS